MIRGAATLSQTLGANGIQSIPGGKWKRGARTLTGGGSDSSLAKNPPEPNKAWGSWERTGRPHGGLRARGRRVPAGRQRAAGPPERPRCPKSPGAVYLLLLDGAEEEAALAVGKRCLLHAVESPRSGAARSAASREAERPHARRAPGAAQASDVIRPRRRGGAAACVRMLEAGGVFLLPQSAAERRLPT